jgi:hypothetical protein
MPPSAQTVAPRVARRDRESGAALVWALIFVVVTTSLVLAHSTRSIASLKQRNARYEREALASTFARSGLQDALGWFRSRPSYPVQAFDPAFDPIGSPPRLETMDPTVGLVREFEIQGNTWGRYEIRREEVTDISGERGESTPGSAWEVRVRSYVFRRNDPDAAFDSGENQILGQSTVSSEFRWLQITPPAPAALSLQNVQGLKVHDGVSVDGGDSIGIAYPDPSLLGLGLITPLISVSADLRGSQTLLPSVSISLLPKDTVSLRPLELRSFADVVVGRGENFSGTLAKLATSTLRTKNSHFDANDIQKVRIDGKVVYAPGDVVLDGPTMITNSLVFIDGSLSTAPTSDVEIRGIVYVNGDVKIANNNFRLRGTMVANGAVELGDVGTSVSNVSLTYDPRVIDSTRRIVGRYRLRRGGESW